MSILEPVLGGKKRFWLEKSVDNTRLVTNMAGWSLFGVAVHAWHRGIQKKALGRRKLFHRVVATLRQSAFSASSSNLADFYYS